MTVTTPETIDVLATDVLSGNRRALARACSLVESTVQRDRDSAVALLDVLLPHCVASRRIGVSGAPGVGKSTFVESFGMSAIAHGSKVAVLAVDPSSKRTGGSILGDKVRMQNLGNDANAYVRPSPSRLTLGGATSSTRELIVVCEAAGYDTIIIETVGVGQSEIEVADMVDMFLLLVLANAGDDVQGIKRGIMEVADAIVVTKSDVDDSAAKRAIAQYTGTLRFLIPSNANWTAPVIGTSALAAQGIDDVMASVKEFFSDARRDSIEERRNQQRRSWFETALRRRFVEMLASDVNIGPMLEALQQDVENGHALPSSAVHRFVSSIAITFQKARL